jgi:hypothetical protein
MDASRTNLRIDGRSMRQLSRRFKHITPKASLIPSGSNAQGVAIYSPVNAEGVR